MIALDAWRLEYERLFGREVLTTDEVDRLRSHVLNYESVAPVSCAIIERLIAILGAP